jgi:hypothetical protein
MTTPLYTVAWGIIAFLAYFAVDVYSIIKEGRNPVALCLG